MNNIFYKIYHDPTDFVIEKNHVYFNMKNIMIQSIKSLDVAQLIFEEMDHETQNY